MVLVYAEPPWLMNLILAHKRDQMVEGIVHPAHKWDGEKGNTIHNSRNVSQKSPAPELE